MQTKSVQVVSKNIICDEDPCQKPSSAYIAQNNLLSRQLRTRRASPKFYNESSSFSLVSSWADPEEEIKKKTGANDPGKFLGKETHVPWRILHNQQVHVRRSKAELMSSPIEWKLATSETSWCLVACCRFSSVS